MNEKLTLQDIVVLLAKKADITQKEADKFYRELVQLILECIYKNEIVKIKDFGTFKLVSISERESVDVNTGDKIVIPPHYKMSFTPDKSLKTLVNKPFAHFESVVLDDDIESSAVEKDPENIIEELPSEPIEEEDITTQENTESLEYIPISIEEPSDEIEESDNDVDDSLTDTDDPEEEDEDDDILSTEVFDEIVIDTSSLDNIVKDELLDIDDNVLLGFDDLENTSLLPDNDEDLVEPPKPKVLKKKLKLASKQNKNTNLSKSQVDGVSDKMSSSDKVEEADNGQNSHDEKEIRMGIDEESDAFDKTQEEEKDYTFSYSNYEQKSVATKIKQKLPLILFIGGVLCFVVYQVAKLLDFTPDYEYYIGRTKNLSLTDTLPYLNDNTSTFDILDTVILAESSIVPQTEKQDSVFKPENAQEASLSNNISEVRSGEDSASFKVDKEGTEVQEQPEIVVPSIGEAQSIEMANLPSGTFLLNKPYIKPKEVSTPLLAEEKVNNQADETQVTPSADVKGDDKKDNAPSDNLAEEAKIEETKEVEVVIPPIGIGESIELAELPAGTRLLTKPHIEPPLRLSRADSIAIDSTINAINGQFALIAEHVRNSEQRFERERLEKERLEEQRLEEERLEKKRLEELRLEEERLEKKRLEEQRLEEERLEKKKLEEQRLVAERIEKERVEKEQAEKLRAEKEKAEMEKAEQDRKRIEQEKKMALRVDEKRLVKESGYDTAAAKRSYKISEGLNLRIVNKAGLHVNNRSGKSDYGNIVLE